jgi:hypothetical protein
MIYLLQCLELCLFHSLDDERGERTVKISQGRPRAVAMNTGRTKCAKGKGKTREAVTRTTIFSQGMAGPESPDASLIRQTPPHPLSSDSVRSAAVRGACPSGALHEGLLFGSTLRDCTKTSQSKVPPYSTARPARERGCPGCAKCRLRSGSNC